MNEFHLSDLLEKPGQQHETVDICLEVAKPLQVKKSITYIICGVLFRKINDDLEVLMMQETRKDCKGAWYLPAGRLEAGETIEEGMMREVLEETGIVCKSDGLLSVESVEQSSWFRFTFLATEIGGTLKTFADTESLQAKWYPIDDVLKRKIHLRSSDILKLIEFGRERYLASKRKLAANIIHSIDKLLCRLFVVHSVNNKTYGLVRKFGETYKLPVVEFSQKIWFGCCVNCISKLFTKQELIKVVACLSLESNTKPAYEHDGFLITLLCKVNSEEELCLTEDALGSGYFLQELENETVLENINLWSSFGSRLF